MEIEIETRHYGDDWQFRLIVDGEPREHGGLPSLITNGPFGYSAAGGFPSKGWIKTTAWSRRGCRRYADWFIRTRFAPRENEPVERQSWGSLSPRSGE